MNRDKIIEKMLREVSFRLPCGGAFLDLESEEHIMIMEDVLLDDFHINRETVNEIIETLQKNKSGKLSDEDSSLLKTLGMENVEKVDLSKFNPHSVVFDTGGSGVRVFQEKKVNFRTVENFVRTQSKCVITISKTINKLRSEDNTRIVQWKPSRGPGDGNYEQILAVFLLYKSNTEKIDITTKAPPGISYEVRKTEEINKVLKASAVPYKLYVQKDNLIKSMGVMVKKAEKVAGVGKADIALKDQIGHEVFWISYKHGDFFGPSGEIATTVPFQQYGSIQGIYNRAEDLISGKLISDARDVKGEDLKHLVDYFIKRVIRKMSNPTMIGVDDISLIPPDEENILVHLKEGRSIKISKGHSFYPLLNDRTILRRIQKAIEKEKSVNLYFYPQGTKIFYFDFLKSKLLDKKILKTIAGKSIYGKEFYHGNTKFGRENVNILMQTSKMLEIKQHKEARGSLYEEVDGVIIKTDERGHILFNPNLPNEDFDKAMKEIERYMPVLYCRFTTDEVFKWKDEKGTNLFLGCRVFIYPKGKVSGTAEEIIVKR